MPEAQSPISTRPVRRPRAAASRAMPAPVMPPPTTRTSSPSPPLIASRAAVRCSRVRAVFSGVVCLRIRAPSLVCVWTGSPFERDRSGCAAVARRMRRPRPNEFVSPGSQAHETMGKADARKCTHGREVGR